MTTRRDILKSGAGLAAILASGKAPAALVRSMLASRGSFLVRGAGANVPTARDYVQSGLIAMWDGIENAGWGTHDANATSWVDLVGGVPMNNSRFSDDYAIPAGNTMTQSNLYPFLISGDFTLHGCLVNAPREWYNWTEIGIGVGAGVQNGINICAMTASHGVNYDVTFRKAYAGTIECKAATNTVVGQKYSCDIVFHFATKSYDVFVNGILTGSATIPDGAWNLDGVSCSIGYGLFNNLNSMGDFKVHNIMYYSRALNAAEIAANYAVDKQRFNLA